MTWRWCVIAIAAPVQVIGTTAVLAWAIGLGWTTLWEALAVFGGGTLATMMGIMIPEE